MSHDGGPTRHPGHALPIAPEDTERAPEGVKVPGERQAEPPTVCRKLRTKMAFGSLHEGTLDWRHGHSSTAVYWCLSTMETAGPDDSYAHPHGCRAGRSCYLPPPGAELDEANDVA
ncbi:hypothetical protein [Chondromyces crocatus]|uniref:Uncharacterized protein n=1 Tax=Chondromyces crocatus TaxID=52 RepID=A0A0K1E7I1_CHOCO|nr:hypothetical protein [Chondromyces crocatus]AKT36841.1 uncharacterized protein CMC5_009620 [Chondromyces crocatus]